MRFRPDLEGPAWDHVEIATLVRAAETFAGWLDGRWLAEDAAAAAEGYESALRVSEALNRALEEGGVAKVRHPVVREGLTLKEVLALHFGVRPEDIVEVRLEWKVSAQVPEVARYLATDGDWGEYGEVYVPADLERELRALPAIYELVGLGVGLFPAAPRMGQRLQYVIAHGGRLWGGWVREGTGAHLRVPAMVDGVSHVKVGDRWVPVRGGSGPELPPGLQQAVAQAAWALMEMGVVDARKEREARYARLLGIR